MVLVVPGLRSAQGVDVCCLQSPAQKTTESRVRANAGVVFWIMKRRVKTAPSGFNELALYVTGPLRPQAMTDRVN